MADAAPRLVIVTSHPIQYQAPLWRALAADGRVRPHVLYLLRHGLEPRVDEQFGAQFAWDIDLLGGYEHTFVENLREGHTPGRPLSYVNPSLVRSLAGLDPDVVLFFGLRSPSALAALAWARSRGIPTMYRADSSVLDGRSRFARRAGRWLIHRTQAVLSIGTANDLYYDQLGYPEHRRFLAPYAVDNDFFQRSAIPRSDARARLGIPPDDLVVLYAGKLVEWKDPSTLVDACADVGGERRLHLLVAGDGALRAEIEHRARSRGVRLTMLGFVNQSELGSVYSAGDVLVMPSRREAWGLVLNEAMNFALPVLASTRVGARLDLVIAGVNGDVFPVGGVSRLRETLSRLVATPELVSQWGSASRAIIDRWNVQATVDGTIRAINAVV